MFCHLPRHFSILSIAGLSINSNLLPSIVTSSPPFNHRYHDTPPAILPCICGSRRNLSSYLSLGNTLVHSFVSIPAKMFKKEYARHQSKSSPPSSSPQNQKKKKECPSSKANSKRLQSPRRPQAKAQILRPARAAPVPPRHVPAPDAAHRRDPPQEGLPREHKAARPQHPLRARLRAAVLPKRRVRPAAAPEARAPLPAGVS